MKNHRGQWLLLQRQHIELGLQHGLEVLMEKERNTLCFRETYKQHYASISAQVRLFFNNGGGCKNGNSLFFFHRKNVIQNKTCCYAKVHNYVQTPHVIYDIYVITLSGAPLNCHRSDG